LLYRGVVITNGQVGLGINQYGDLNVANQAPSSQGTSGYGLRFLKTGAEFTAPGCDCEGWGIADAGSKIRGWVDENIGHAGLVLQLFSHTANTATSVVTVGLGSIEITHDYHPAFATRALFESDVTIRNIGTLDLTDIRYRRVVDWDMEPTAFSEFVTNYGFGTAPYLSFVSDDGFASPNPLTARTSIDFTGNATRNGPADHGALFEFDLGDLPPGASIGFKEYYGAASGESAALTALQSVGAQAYSLGEPMSGPAGWPNTAILGFSFPLAD
nr:hypothetical protein [Actinomycetota bacterium]